MSDDPPEVASSDVSDERLERAVRRAVRKELELLGERLFWTLLAAFAALWGVWFVTAGTSSPDGIWLAGLGALLIALAVWRLLWAWDLPPFASRSA